MAKNKTDKEVPQSQETPEEVDDNWEEFEDPYPLPPLKSKRYIPNPNARPARGFVTYPY